MRPPAAGVAAAAGLSAMILGLAMTGIAPLAAQTQGDAETYEDRSFRYAVTLPAGCRHEEGPGTIDAVCAPDFDAEKSKAANAASAVVLAVAAEAVDGGADTGIAGLLQRHPESTFKAELPEAVCGEEDRARVKIENLTQDVEGNRIIYTADVHCAEIKFLQISARRAIVRHVVGPDVVYRLMARAPAEEFDKQRPVMDAFLASFRLMAIEKAEQ